MRWEWASLALAVWATGTLAQNCISLGQSTACSAFAAASVSTDAAVVGLYPFLQFVSSVQDFDRELTTYVSQGYVQQKYVYLFGCDNVNLANTTDYYARYTTSFLCNSIIQNSRTTCGLTDANATPLCADSCADLARSEEAIISSSDFCSGRSAGYVDQLRADFTNCALPANSLSGTCIRGVQNEPNNCGYGGNLVGLCNYCRGSTENATDSCCFTSNTEGRCQDVTLPVFSSVADLFSSTASPTGSATSSSPAASSSAAGAVAPTSDSGSGLSGGAIAGIVIGSIAGFLLLLGLIVFCCIRYRRRRQGSTNGSILNQPSPQRKGASVSYQQPPSSQQGYEVLPGGRVARLAALSSEDPSAKGPRGFGNPNDPYGDSPGSGEKVAGVVGGIKAPISERSSPGSNNYSSPEGMASGQSEQLPFFKDYYSNGDIHPDDHVSVLWAYQPRAGDEFELERGDMLKVVGIWDDGWATGVRLNDRAEEYGGKYKASRDSGVSDGSVAREESPSLAGEIKAFPLVCVCLPEAWKKTVDGESSEGASGGPQL